MKLTKVVCTTPDGDSQSPKILKSIFEHISTIKYSDYLLYTSEKPSQSKQKKRMDKVKKLQEAIVNKLNDGNLNELVDLPLPTKWKKEHRPRNGQRDSIDIYGLGKDIVQHVVQHIVIELDSARADQVAKKFVSRIALITNPPSASKICYISLCYPGAPSMPVPEAEKYFKYCAELAALMKISYAGFIIKPDPPGAAFPDLISWS